MTSALFRCLVWLDRCADMIRLLKGYAYAVALPPLGIYALVHGEPLAACVFTGIGLLCLSVVVERHIAAAPEWCETVGLVSGGVGLLALVILVARAMQEEP